MLAAGLQHAKLADYRNSPRMNFSSCLSTKPLKASHRTRELLERSRMVSLLELLFCRFIRELCIIYLRAFLLFNQFRARRLSGWKRSCWTHPRFMWNGRLRLWSTKMASSSRTALLFEASMFTRMFRRFLRTSPSTPPAHQSCWRTWPKVSLTLSVSRLSIESVSVHTVNQQFSDSTQ